MTSPQDQKSPPMFNLEPVIITLIVIILSVHVIKTWFIPQDQGLNFLLLFAAIPARYSEFGDQIPFAFAAWYTPLTHMFLHGDWAHLAFNSLWLLAFGSPVAIRLGAKRFILFSIVGAVVGFLFHLATHIGEFTPMVGASGAVSAYMAGAIRLQRDPSKPVLPLTASFQNRGIIAFIVVWFALNLVTGYYPALIGVEGAQIAWQAHIGGFLSGLLLIGILDPKLQTRNDFV